MSITRRRLLKTVALGATIGQTACWDSCTDDQLDNVGFVFIYLYGQVGKVIEAEIDKRIEKRNPPLPFDPSLPDPDEAALELLRRWFSTGGLSSVTGGPAPSGGTQSKSLPTRRASSDARSFYLLDNLGDANVDGRVIAIDVTATTAQERGSAVLRPFTPNGATLRLNHIALSPDGNQLIVSQAGSQAGDPAQWIFIDARTLQIQRMLAPVNVFPRRVVYSPDGRLAYALASNLRSDNTSQLLSVQIIDTAARAIAGVIPMPAFTAIEDWTITPDGGLLFGVGNAFLHVLDVASRTYSDRFDIIQPLSGPTLSGSTGRIAMHPDGERMFTLIRRFDFQNLAEGSVGVVGVVDVRTASKIAEYPVRLAAGTTGMILTLSPSGRTLVAGFQRGPELQMFDTLTGAEIHSINVGASFGLAGAFLA